MKNKKCYLCGSQDCVLVSEIRQKPEKETNFAITPNSYYRAIYQCNNCGVYFNWHNYDLSKLYEGLYNKATYDDNILEKYSKIMAFPEEKSDNKQRVKRVVEFAKKNSFEFKDTKVLDVGSGLCVFLGELKKFGFKCYCIDPDPLSTKHALENVKVDGAHCGTLDDFNPDEKTGNKFNIIAFNKVLEHVENPIKVLKQARAYLADGGFIYIELPDAETAVENGGAVEREEFYLEHYTMFTKKSFEYLIKNAGFKSLKMKAIHEPSDKYTLYAFIKIK